MKPRHFAAKLTPGGGPAPFLELEQIIAFAEESTERTTWVALKKTGVRLSIQHDSRALLIATGTRQIRAVLSSLVSKTSCPPDVVRDWYADHQGEWTFFELRSPVLIEGSSYEDLPGRPASGLDAAKTFSGQVSFTYWDFTAAVDGIDTQAVNAPMSYALEGSGGLRPRPEVARQRAPQTAGGDSFVASWHVSTAPLRFPGYSLNGVDFSGAREREGRNGKLWIATWDSKGIALRCGGDVPGFGRAGLAPTISSSLGLWILDFPFGLPAQLCRALGLATHDDYLKWCNSDADASRLRDVARQAAQKMCVNWSSRRRVDYAHGTTWFPLFEQLYRQTIRGGADVLHTLRASGSSARILPQDSPTDPRGAPHVVEGFPGHTIRSLALPATGYKSASATARAARLRILSRLIDEGLPIPRDAWGKAEQDAEGDALDALVLLLAAHRAARRTADQWTAPVKDAALEGWFFD